MALITNVMGFRKASPPPFESFKSAVGSSKYSTLGYSRVAGRSSLSGDLILAMYLFGGIDTVDKANFGIGISTVEHCYVLEYKKENADGYEFVTYYPETGQIETMIYDDIRQTGEPLREGTDELDAVPLFLCMFPVFLKDDEFRSHYEEFISMGKNGFPNVTEARTVVGILCDNIYRRMLIDSLDTSIKLNEKIDTISFTDRKISDLTPDKVLCGMFHCLNGEELVVHKKLPGGGKKAMDQMEFAGKFQINQRMLSPKEKELVPVLEDWYIVKKEDIEICDSIRCTSNMDHPFRNFILLGTAGSGKSKTCEAVAAGLHLPLVRYTCSSNTEIFDFIGQVMPDVETSKEEAPRFIYTKTEFIEAVKHGWVVEIQEPDIIANEGVLVGLNGLLEEGQMTLPTGEVIKRHPDNIIIFTANMGYNGCREMNQSVLDRADEVYYIETPTPEIMAKRAMAISKHPSYETVLEMAQIITDIANSMKEMGVTSGVCGMRSLIAWSMKSLMMNPYDSAITTMVNKLSLEEEEREVLLARLNNSSFYK